MKIFQNSTLNPGFSEKEIVRNSSLMMCRDDLDGRLEEINAMEAEEISKWKSKKPMTVTFMPTKELQEKIDSMLGMKLGFQYLCTEAFWKIEANISVFSGKTDIVGAFEKFKEKVKNARKPEEYGKWIENLKGNLEETIQQRWQIISESAGTNNHQKWSRTYIGLERSGQIGSKGGWTNQPLPNLFQVDLGSNNNDGE
ncbi:MAG: hypothetical protein AABY16_02660 [Nanoarchaeota archaeon]